MANSVDPDQTAPIGAVCSGSTLFASILNLSVMLGNYLQQTTSADNIFRCIFSWCFKAKIPNAFLFLFSIEMLLFRAGILKMLDKVANREDPDQTASSEAV